MCILLGVAYHRYVTKQLLVNIIITTWLVAFTSGLFLWACLHIHYKVIFWFVFITQNPSRMDGASLDLLQSPEAAQWSS